MPRKPASTSAKKSPNPRGKKKVHIAIVGAGSRARQAHYPSLASFKDVEIAAICDIDPARLSKTADQYGIEKRYGADRDPLAYRKMIEDIAPDGVYVIGQPHIMYPLWVWCLQQKLNLFIEKPMGLTRHQSRMLAHLAGEAGVITQVAYQRRSSPLLRKMHAECLKHGPITHAVCEFYKCEVNTWLDAHSRMMSDTVHAIDTVRWMCGGEVIDIDSRCRRIGGADIDWIGAMLHFDNGSTGFVLTSWCSGRRVFRVEMHAPGIAADANVEGEARLHVDGDVEGKVFNCFDVAGGKDNWAAFGDRDKNREFIDSLKTGREKTSSPFSDAVKTTEVACKILGQAALRDE
jgi:predicted dehydrogenase